MPEATPQSSQSVAVIGAGPAGLTAADQLCRRGFQVEVFEADSAVGGMAKTVRLWGRRVDLGPHRFFSSDPRVNAIWLEAAGKRFHIVKRLTRILYQGTFFNYPLKPVNALKGLGLAEAVRCLLSYARARLFPLKGQPTFEAWVTNRFGGRLYRIFFKSYSEKLWGIPCSELDADFAAQRIKKLSLFEAVKDALLKSGAGRHKTLADAFAYPDEGAGAVYEAMARSIEELGGTIRLKTPVARVRPAAQGRPALLRLSNGEERSFDHVVSSMPISTLIEGLDAPEDIRSHARALTFRNTILVYLLVEGKDLFPDQWLYVHSPELRTGRVTNFSNWSASPGGEASQSVLCFEYWCQEEDELWSLPDQELFTLARADAARTSLVPEGSIAECAAIRIPKSYPVYKAGYRRHLEPLERYLAGLKGLTVIGRYGSFKYNNQDHSILMGLLAAENISGEAEHDLWSVNTDDEYQELSRITATGLTTGRKKG